MGSVGLPEVLVILAVLAFCALPVTASVWAVFTRHYLPVGQEALQRQLASIERAL